MESHQEINMKWAEDRIEKIIDIAQDPEFIKLSARAAKKMGITAEEWNNNRAAILMDFAHEMLLMIEEKQKNIKEN